MDGAARISRACGSLRETGKLWVFPAPSLPTPSRSQRLQRSAGRLPACLPSLGCLSCLDWQPVLGHARLTASPCASRLTRCRPSASPALWEIFPSERQEPRHPWDLRWEAFPGLGLGAGSLLPSKWDGFSRKSHSQGCPSLPRKECLATRIAVQVSKRGKFLGDSDLMAQDVTLWEGSCIPASSPGA